MERKHLNTEKKHQNTGQGEGERGGSHSGNGEGGGGRKISVTSSPIWKNLGPNCREGVPLVWFLTIEFTKFCLHRHLIVRGLTEKKQIIFITSRGRREIFNHVVITSFAAVCVQYLVYFPTPSHQIVRKKNCPVFSFV